MKHTIEIDIDRVRRKVELHALGRRDNLGNDHYHEVDFFAGAAAMFDAIGLWEKVPPMWILGPASGRSPLDPL